MRALEQTQYFGTYKVWDMYEGVCIGILVNRIMADILCAELTKRTGEKYQVTGGSCCICPDDEVVK